jgi:hypothetical protein
VADSCYTTKDNTRVPSLLQNFATTKNRLGLHLIPPQLLETGTITEDFDIDIVAVHGLGGDFFKTWTKSIDTDLENDVYWLSQLLPVTLPGARVYSFGYDAEPAFTKSVANIRTFSKQLLSHLLAQPQAVSFP